MPVSNLNHFVVSMKNVVRQTRAHLLELFEKHGFNPRHDLGQNFLIDLNIIEAIVREATLTRNDVVLEVGTGTGGMTTFMAVQAAHVVSVEYDHNMFQLAQDQAGGFENITLLHMDALKNKNHFAPAVLEAVQAALAVDPRRRLKLVANLPYNIATPIISNLVATELPWERIVATIQLELAERMAATPEVSNYGALSVWLQSQADVKIARRMPPEVFWPRPKVDSAVVRLIPVPERRALIANREFLHDFLRRLFTQRRKYLRSVVCGMYSSQLSKTDVDAALALEQLPEGVRAEQLSVATLVSVSNRLHDAILRSSQT